MISRSFSWTSAFFMVVGVLWCVTVRAEKVGDIEIGNPELSISGATGGCGQSCLYLKANDVLGMRAIYLQKMAATLIQQREDRGKADSSERAEIDSVLRRNLEVFCKTQKIKMGTSWSQDWDTCLGNYLQTVARSLEMTRKALVENYDAVSQLTGGVALPSRNLSDPRNAERLMKDRGAALLKSKKITLYPDFPLLPSLDSVDPILKRLGDSATFRIKQRKAFYGAQEQQKADEALAQWWDRFPRCPARDEFARVEMVERYPSHPTGEKLPRIVTGKDGKIAIDEARYQEALKGCNDRKKDHFREFPIPDEFLERTSHESRLALREAQEGMVGAIDQKMRGKSDSKQSRGADHVTILGKDQSDSKNSMMGGEQLDQDIAKIRQFARRYQSFGAGED